MLAPKSQRDPQRQVGVVVVEFTIVVALLIMLVMATAEFGRAFLQYNALSKAVRDAARYVAGRALVGSQGIVSVTPTMQTEAQNLVIYGNTFGAGAPLLPGLGPGDVTVIDAGGGNIRVSASYSYNPIFAFIPGFFYGGDTDVSGYTLPCAVTMRAL